MKHGEWSVVPPAPSRALVSTPQLGAVATVPAPATAAPRLWVAVHMPRFTLDMALRGNATQKACVLVEGEGRQQRVTLANAEATRLGIRAGLPLSAAHALGEVLAFTRVPAVEQQALQQLCAWAYQFTPVLAPLAPDALVMEVRGSLQLFGGLSGLLSRLRRELRQLGFQTVAFGTAPTPTAAHWLARARQSAPVESLAALPAALSQVPLDVMGLAPRLLQDLCGIGVRSIGECLRLPRDSLARRFTPELLLALDRALGRQPDPQPAFQLPASFASRIDLLWEIHHAQGLSLAMERLLNELTGVLRAQGRAIRQLDWRLHHANGAVSVHPIKLLQQSRDLPHLFRISREYFLRQQLSAPVRGISLEAANFELLPAVTAGDLFSPAKAAAETETWPQFVERLRARLGDESLRALTTRADHRPERASCATVVRHDNRPRAGSMLVTSRRWPERPLWLTRTPVPLADENGRPTFDGPLELTPERERIEAGWWDGAEVARDYFIARNRHGSRLWVFRELSGARGWYLHGIFE